MGYFVADTAASWARHSASAEDTMWKHVDGTVEERDVAKDGTGHGCIICWSWMGQPAKEETPRRAHNRRG